MIVEYGIQIIAWIATNTTQKLKINNTVIQRNDRIGLKRVHCRKGEKHNCIQFTSKRA